MTLLGRLADRLRFELDVARGLNTENNAARQPRASLQFHQTPARHELGEAREPDDLASIDEWGPVG